MFIVFVRRVFVACGMMLLLWAAPATALQPDEIALIVNSNEPVGRDLAHFYAQIRHIPDNRIIELDLPRGEDISFKGYEETVVPQVREYLRSADLVLKVKCFVTFYGVPLRIDPRVNTPAENQEQANLRRDLLNAAADVVAPVQSLEDLAKQVDLNFVPGVGKDLDHLAQRANAAEHAIISHIRVTKDVTEQALLGEKLYAALEPLAGEAVKVKRLELTQALAATTQKVDTTPAVALVRQYNLTLGEAAELEQFRYDATKRKQLRELVAKHFGYFNYVKLLRDQVEYLETKDTGAAFDNELALVKWIAYSRARWHENPLYFDQPKPTGPQSPTYMVMRLDAPKPETVKNMITASIEAELHGLQGKVVLDSRGMNPANQKGSERGLGEYDQSIRNLGELVRDHTRLELVADDKPDLLPPHSVDGVALYCGWYSLRHYVPCCTFNPGAVGFHIASGELISLHTPGESGWVAGLLNDGVVATLGPVDEPFVQAFPRADEFFSLLLTGKLSLAEVYWKTTPMTSWMISMIGDPLYTPYKTNPALDVKDLPSRMRSIFTEPTSRP